jgi:hypothetical protein
VAGLVLGAVILLALIGAGLAVGSESGFFGFDHGGIPHLVLGR